MTSSNAENETKNIASFIKALKAFKKPFEAPQRSVKIKS